MTEAEDFFTILNHKSENAYFLAGLSSPQLMKLIITFLHNLECFEVDFNLPRKLFKLMHIISCLMRTFCLNSLNFFFNLEDLFLQDSSLLSLPFLASELYRNVTRRSTSSILKKRSKPFVRNFQKKSIRQPLECSGYQKVFTNQQLNYFIFIKKQGK